MKNLQTLLLKSLFTFFLLVSACYSFGQFSKLRQADSLFRSKQYTQSAEIYKSVLQEKKYSPAVLLKLAFIEEGLGKIGLTLYYLKLYYLASDDAQALGKMEELAAKYNVNGYSLKETDHLGHWLEKNRMKIMASLVLLLLSTCFLWFYLQKENKKNMPTALAVGLLSVCLLIVNNYASPTSVIIKNNGTHLMNGPSAAASVVAVLQEGNQLQAVGQEDVWLKLKWENKTAYVKKTDVLKIDL